MIYPDSRAVYEYKAGGTVCRYDPGETLTLLDILPDWQFPVAKLFED